MASLWPMCCAVEDLNRSFTVGLNSKSAPERAGLSDGGRAGMDSARHVGSRSAPVNGAFLDSAAASSARLTGRPSRPRIRSKGVTLPLTTSGAVRQTLPSWGRYRNSSLPGRVSRSCSSSAERFAGIVTASVPRASSTATAGDATPISRSLFTMTSAAACSACGRRCADAADALAGRSTIVLAAGWADDGEPAWPKAEHATNRATTRTNNLRMASALRASRPLVVLRGL